MPTLILHFRRNDKRCFCSFDQKHFFTSSRRSLIESIKEQKWDGLQRPLIRAKADSTAWSANSRTDLTNTYKFIRITVINTSINNPQKQHLNCSRYRRRLYTQPKLNRSVIGNKILLFLPFIWPKQKPRRQTHRKCAVRPCRALPLFAHADMPPPSMTEAHIAVWFLSRPNKFTSITEPLHPPRIHTGIDLTWLRPMGGLPRAPPLEEST